VSSLKRKMEVGIRDNDASPINRFSISGTYYGKQAYPLQYLRQMARMIGSQMHGNEQGAGKISRKLRDKLLQCSDATSGCSHNDDLSGLHITHVLFWL
jgi:hypothetical protein